MTTAAPPRTLDPERLGDHLDRLHRAARALTGCPHDAQDLVQATYERILRRPRILREEDDLGYLLRALRHTFYSERRSEARRPCIPADPEDLEFVDGSVHVVGSPGSGLPLGQLSAIANPLRYAFGEESTIAARLTRRAYASQDAPLP